jgi:hypothetical protein
MRQDENRVRRKPSQPCRAAPTSVMGAEKNRPREQLRLYDFTAPGLDQRTKR